jgi:hypothetical protein
LSASTFGWEALATRPRDGEVSVEVKRPRRQTARAVGAFSESSRRVQRFAPLSFS